MGMGMGGEADSDRLWVDRCANGRYAWHIKRRHCYKRPASVHEAMTRYGKAHPNPARSMLMPCPESLVYMSL